MHTEPLRDSGSLPFCATSIWRSFLMSQLSGASAGADALSWSPTAAFGARCHSPDACNSGYIIEGIHGTVFGIQYFCIKLPRWPQICTSVLLLLHLLNLLILFILSFVSKILPLQFLCHLSSSCPFLPFIFLVSILQLLFM